MSTAMESNPSFASSKTQGTALTSEASSAVPCGKLSQSTTGISPAFSCAFDRKLSAAKTSFGEQSFRMKDISSLPRLSQIGTAMAPICQQA